jgi:transposase-like protein
VEADETFLGGEETHRRRKGGSKKFGPHNKRKILALVQRNGECRSFHIADLRVETIAPIVRTNIRRESILSTDEARYYRNLGKEFAAHLKVEHGDDEYVRGDAHVNTAEGLFSIFKRGMKGIYQHCGEQHLHRYLAEFDFRYNNRIALGIGDEARAGRAIKGIVGKRLTYRNPNETPAWG